MQYYLGTDTGSSLNTAYERADAFGTISAYAAEKHIFDDEGYFSDVEISTLEDKLAAYESSAGIDIIVITAGELGGKSTKRYLEDYSDILYDSRSASFDAVFMLYGRDSQSRYCEIQGYGKAETYINDYRIEKMLDEVIPYLADGKLTEGSLLFAERSAEYMNRHPVRDKIYAQPWVQFIAALIIGAAAVGIMAASSGGRMTVNNQTYLDGFHSGITARRDQYIRTSVTKRRRPQQQSSGGGGGGGGRSSGGRSHSGGGRRF